MIVLRPAIMFLVIVVNLVLQSTLFQYIEILNIKPNSSILIIVCYAILRGDVEGSIFGFVTGLLQDIFFGKFIGLYALFGLLVGFFCGMPFKNFFRENIVLSFFLTAFMTFAYGFAFYVTNFLFRGKLDFYYYFNRIILPEVAYTTFLSVVFYGILYFINQKVEIIEKQNRKVF